MSDAIADNPLLEVSGLPHFDRIKPEHVEPAISRSIRASNTDGAFRSNDRAAISAITDRT